MPENQLTIYVAALVATARVTHSIRDTFVIRKLHQKIYTLVEAYQSFILSPHHQEQQRLLVAIDTLQDLIEYEEHLQRSDIVALAYARRALLRFRLFVQHVEIKQSTPTSASPVISTEPEVRKEKIKVNENKKKILSFIRQSPVRTKEIVDEFHLMSSRTVKRSLKELTKAGLVKRKSKDRGVVYSVAD